MTLRNRSDVVAFFLELRLTGVDGKTLVPVLWDDNYVSLLPGEERVLEARFGARALERGAPGLTVKGFNT